MKMYYLLITLNIVYGDAEKVSLEETINLNGRKWENEDYIHHGYIPKGMLVFLIILLMMIKL